MTTFLPTDPDNETPNALGFCITIMLRSIIRNIIVIQKQKIDVMRQCWCEWSNSSEPAKQDFGKVQKIFYPLIVAQEFPTPFRFRLRQKLHSVGNSFAFAPQTLRWFAVREERGRSPLCGKSFFTAYCKISWQISTRNLSTFFYVKTLLITPQRFLLR